MAKKKSTGQVKWFDSIKRYGFIKQDDGEDLFFHKSDVVGEADLREEDKVEFEVVKGDKGDKAANVKKVK